MIINSKAHDDKRNVLLNYFSKDRIWYRITARQQTTTNGYYQ